MSISNQQQADDQYQAQEATKSSKPKKPSFHATLWRWHFYAGLVFAPFLIILAFSGAVYLFKPQIESFIYKDLYEVKATDNEQLSASKQVESVYEEYPDATITSMLFSDDPNRTTKMGLMANGEETSVYVNPYNGTIAGTMKAEDEFTEVFKRLHSELIVGGTVANRIIELAACWAIILLLTGLYLWWPRNRASIFGTVIPRLRSKGRTFWRDIHAVPAFWLSIFIVVLIATGLPWSGVMGEQINKLAVSTNTGFPETETPISDVKTKDVATDVPWAAENIPVPVSTLSESGTLSADEVSMIADTNAVVKPYTISFPEGEEGVYTISSSHTKPGDNTMLHVDQYDGVVLTDVRFSDYGIMAKGILYGIALHEGRLFGLANQIIGLIVCIGLIGIVLSSFVMLKKRKPEGKLGAPKKTESKKVQRVVLGMMLVLGILMPLVGISIVVVFLFDRFVLPLMPKVQKWLGA